MYGYIHVAMIKKLYTIHSMCVYHEAKAGLGRLSNPKIVIERTVSIKNTYAKILNYVATYWSIVQYVDHICPPRSIVDHSSPNYIMYIHTYICRFFAFNPCIAVVSSNQIWLTQSITHKTEDVCVAINVT